MPVDSSPPTPPEPQPQPSLSSRRSTKMHENHDTWGHSTVRDIRDPRDPRDMRDPQLREYPRTPPPEWKSYTQRRPTYSSQLDRDCLSDLSRQREDENDDEEAYWSSVKTLYEKTPSCSRPRPVSRTCRPRYPGCRPAQPHSPRLPQQPSPPRCREVQVGPKPPSCSLGGGGGGWGVSSTPVLQARAQLFSSHSALG